MTTLAEVMLDLAGKISRVERGTATGGTTSTLIDTSLVQPASFFRGGTFWCLSGDNSGVIDTIISHSLNTLTLATTQTKVYAAGNRYAVSDLKFPRRDLKKAVLDVLMETDVPSIDTSMTAASGEATLSTGVGNVKRVLVDGAINNYWREIGGKLIFDYAVEGGLEVWYVAKHAEITETESINTAIDTRWLVWAAAEVAWSDYIKLHEKDRPIAIDFLNKATQQAALYKTNASKRLILSRDVHYKYWSGS